VERALILGAGANAAIAVLQMVADLSAFQLWRFDGRSSGLWGNPVYLSGFLAGAVWLVVPRVRHRPLAWGAFVVLLATALQVAGGRFAVALLAVVLVASWVTSGPRLAVLLAACLGLGLLLGTGLAAQSGGASVSRRTTVAAASGVRPRLESWATARAAIAERPLLGHGPGRYRAPPPPHPTFAMARADGADRLYADAHNLVVEYAVTTGVPGLALLLTWLALAVRRARWRSPLAGFGLLVLAMHLVEPQNVGLTPLAFLALGAAAPVARLPRPVVPFAGRALLAGAGVALAGTLLTGTYHLEQAHLDFTLADARVARGLLPPWPEVREQTARIYTFTAKTERDPDARARALQWRRAAVAADPDDPAGWLDLAEAELSADHAAGAREGFAQALERNPWSARAMNGLGRIAMAEGQSARAGELFRRSLAVSPNQPAIRELLAAVER
jgi:hypothetical protein